MTSSRGVVSFLSVVRTVDGRDWSRRQRGRERERGGAKLTPPPFPVNTPPLDNEEIPNSRM